MNRKSLATLTSLRLAFIAVACMGPVGTHAASSADQQKLASANTGFAFHLLKEIAKEQPEKNIFISPYSVSTVLQMVCNGAGGKTREEMQQVLGTSGLSSVAQNEANNALNQSFGRSKGKVVLDTANALWYRKGFTLKPEFVACNSAFYGTTVDPLDFGNPRAIGIMNAWASKSTHGKISQFLDEAIDPATMVILANAVYFKGDWDSKFDRARTQEQVFHLRNGKEKKVPMMQQIHYFDCFEDEKGALGIAMHYEGREFTMYILLPNEDSSPERLLVGLNGPSWTENIAPRFRAHEVFVMLPRFKLKCETELKRPLTNIGLRHVFENADLSRMAASPLFISRIRQKSFVEVNEEGTEAAAVTHGFATEGPTPAIVIDRPFLFMIQHNPTKSLLFMGVVFDPSASL